MPAGHLLSPSLDALQLPDESVSSSQIGQQAKRCSACQGPLNVDASTAPPPGQSFASEASEPAGLCSVCREARSSQQQQQQSCAALMVCPTASVTVVHDGARDIDVPLRVLQRTHSVPLLDDRQHEAESSSSDEDTQDEESEDSVFSPVDKSVYGGPSVSQSALPVPVPISTSPHRHQLQHSYPQRNPSPISVSPTLRHSAQPRSPLRQTYHSHHDREHEHDHNDGYPDPLVDITRLRVRSKGYRCLQPGATFKGTQRSGRNSYDVNVTIVDVDFASSFLCGYLRIRGLTDDWPELTTYFDAQIIGMRHGFDTSDWGASRQDDNVHWSRFAPFHAIQKDLIEPRLLLPANTARPAVFMRWKERFLVPDHRVEDISGASFAGFYYVCVEFEPQPGSASPVAPQTTTGDMPGCIESGFVPYPTDPSSFSHVQRHHGSRRKPTVPPAVWDDAELAPGEVPRARMCGFYYHKNSEPYQQLSLTHVENTYHSGFEFR
ncbi:hypothetical protein ACEPAF_4385 [Sanghuangporus sanghuang]